MSRRNILSDAVSPAVLSSGETSFSRESADLSGDAGKRGGPQPLSRAGADPAVILDSGRLLMPLSRADADPASKEGPLDRQEKAAVPAWKVYLLECADGSLYCGISRDVERRVLRHNGELPGGAKYTRGRRPVRLLAWVECPDYAAAARLEIAVKKKPRARKLKWLESIKAEAAQKNNEVAKP